MLMMLMMIPDTLKSMHFKLKERNCPPIKLPSNLRKLEASVYEMPKILNVSELNNLVDMKIKFEGIINSDNSISDCSFDSVQSFALNIPGCD
ncbi:unnamed protein product [Ambrosiozyma monospora]|uniref:Unnamed protein product n=1 Tax=Ambrosiozyma monospora TaxID=43982 RepID=A0ACB5SWQ7_AMBMO|nr:unnamed protein product [Ambrosiozyma monospora]